MRAGHGAISIHAPLTGCDALPDSVAARKAISIHAPLTGCDAIRQLFKEDNYDFNPRTPHGVRHLYLPKRLNVGNFNPRTPHGVRLAACLIVNADFYISIHAPLTGCDTTLALCRTPASVFQSTHPSRGATCRLLDRQRRFLHFNPRTPHGVRHDACFVQNASECISIHAPLTGCDVVAFFFCYAFFNFNPRTPHGVRPNGRRVKPQINDFNPRTPHGVRPGFPFPSRTAGCISIHAPLTGCDLFRSNHPALSCEISIHAPLTGCDRNSTDQTVNQCNFNPRTPHGVRRGSQRQTGRIEAISIHAPLTGCDRIDCIRGALPNNFNPRTPHGVRHHSINHGGCQQF